MEDLDFYKSRHHKEYLKRIEEKEEAERKLKESIEYVNTKLSNIIGTTKEHNNTQQIHDSLDEIKLLFDDYESIISMIEERISYGLQLLENISNNTNICINVHHNDERADSYQIKDKLKDILNKLGLDTEGLDLEFEMDCSRDEEIARTLASQYRRPLGGLGTSVGPTIETPVLPPPMPRRRGRPRKNNT